MLQRLVGFVRRVLSRSESEESDDDGTVWAFIPGWQYGGRHAESGGLARAEQEQALREIQQRAEHEPERERR